MIGFLNALNVTLTTYLLHANVVGVNVTGVLHQTVILCPKGMDTILMVILSA